MAHCLEHERIKCRCSNTLSPPPLFPSIPLTFPSYPVRRCLFGPLKDDPSSSQFECSNELRASIAEASRRWDFDFARNAPLSDGPERSFTWEAVPVHGRTAENVDTGGDTWGRGRGEYEGTAVSQHVRGDGGGCTCGLVDINLAG
uniref:Cyclin-dependent kinase inhibitor domain-containing protein n=1 Tax=Eptatretus burgeri TaxID=7764 RepID=A0A8C4PY69_EPTBU